MDLLSLSKGASRPLETSSVHLISSTCTYYHYLCDGTDDRDWGCGYRSLQSLCSWAVRHTQREQQQLPHVQEGRIRRSEHSSSVPVPVSSVPSLRGIQETLVELGDKPQDFVDSREWIGSFEACLILDHLYGVASKIVHVPSGGDVVNHMNTLSEHFHATGSPVMIGGDVDGASKTLIGVFVDKCRPDNTRFLVADPHYCGPPSEETVLSEGHVQWHGLELFQTSSFYNFCLPQPLNSK